jgi:hypothetical protein
VTNALRGSIPSQGPSWSKFVFFPQFLLQQVKESIRKYKNRYLLVKTEYYTCFLLSLNDDGVDDHPVEIFEDEVDQPDEVDLSDVFKVCPVLWLLLIPS